MKLTRRFKIIFLGVLTAMYFSGALTWIMTRWFLLDGGFGLEPSPMRLFWLQLHSTTGMAFLVVFGYLFHAHIIPAWKTRRKRISGAIMTMWMIFLSVTVPGLFYISNDALKLSVAMIHTYVGLAAGGIFLLHYFSKRV